MRNAPSLSCRFLPRAALVALGLCLQPRQGFGPLAPHVPIAPQAVNHPPRPQVEEAASAIMAGAHGLVAITTRVRSALAWAAAFGRQACADPAVVPQTLAACTDDPVAHRPQARAVRSRPPRRGSRHDDDHPWHVLAVERRGLP